MRSVVVALGLRGSQVPSDRPRRDRCHCTVRFRYIGSTNKDLSGLGRTLLGICSVQSGSCGIEALKGIPISWPAASSIMNHSSCQTQQVRMHSESVFLCFTVCPQHRLRMAAPMHSKTYQAVLVKQRTADIQEPPPSVRKTSWFRVTFSFSVQFHRNYHP